MGECHSAPAFFLVTKLLPVVFGSMPAAGEGRRRFLVREGRLGLRGWGWEPVAGPIGTGCAPASGRTPLALGSGFLAPGGEARVHAVGLAPQAGQQLLDRSHTHLVKLEELEHAGIGPAAEGLLEQHGGDQGQIELVADSARAFCQPVPAAEHAFDPPEEALDLLRNGQVSAAVFRNPLRHIFPSVSYHQRTRLTFTRGASRISTIRCMCCFCHR